MGTFLLWFQGDTFNVVQQIEGPLVEKTFCWCSTDRRQRRIRSVRRFLTNCGQFLKFFNKLLDTSQKVPLGKNCITHGTSAVSRTSAFFLFSGMERPTHARRVVGNSEAALSIQQNDSTEAVEALLQIVHRLLRDPRASCRIRLDPPPTSPAPAP